MYKYRIELTEQNTKLLDAITDARNQKRAQKYINGEIGEDQYYYAEPNEVLFTLLYSAAIEEGLIKDAEL